MADTLEVFGTEYTNVAGFKATDDNGNVLTFERGGGGSNIFVVTVSYNDQTEMWEPDCTYAEALVAAKSEKTASVQVDVNSSEASADGDLAYYPAGEEPEESCELEYWVRQYSEDNGAEIIEQKYVLGRVGLRLAEEYTYNEGGGTPNLQTKSVSYTPSETAQSATVTADSGYDGLDEVSVSVGAISSTYVGSGITQRSSTDLTASGATVTVPSGYYSAQASKAVSSGSATAPATISGTSATVSTGTNTLTLSKTVSVTPTVTAGYVSSGTAGNSSVSLTASVTTQGAQTIYPSTSDQTISSGRYLTDAQTIKAVSQTNLSADNIKSGTTITISNGNGNIWSVLGTYTGGGTVNIDTKTVTASTSNYPVSIEFTSMKGEPKAFFLRSTSQISSSGSTTYYYVMDMVYDGNQNNFCNGNVFRIGSTRRIDPITTATSQGITTGYTWSYTGTTLTITSSAASRSASPGAFNNGYQLVYIY